MDGAHPFPLIASAPAAADRHYRDGRLYTGDGWVLDVQGGVEGWFVDDEPADPFGPALTRSEEEAIRARDEAAYWARQREGF